MPVTSNIRLWASSSDYLTLPFAQAAVHYAPSGERIRDRAGLIHRVAPSAPRFPTGLTLRLPPEELTRVSTAAEPQSALAWLERCYRAQSQLLLYVQGESIDDSGAALARPLAYRCYIETLPADGFGTLPGVGAMPEVLEFELLVIEDGTFSSFDSLAGYAPVDRG